MGLENNKRPTPQGRGQLLNLMFSDEAATRLEALTEDEILEEALQSMEPHFPGLSSYLQASRVYRWPLAEPHSPVGRAIQVAAYRSHCETESPTLLLAGDDLSMPFTEGAAESGCWAAGWVGPEL